MTTVTVKASKQDVHMLGRMHTGIRNRYDAECDVRGTAAERINAIARQLVKVGEREGVTQVVIELA